MMATSDLSLDDVTGHIEENLEDDLVKQALSSGLDLRQYSKEIDSELKEVENASIQDYIKESQHIAHLHNGLTTCDEILERMEQMLINFQSDLGTISSDIRSLQDQSVLMNIKLKNRQSIRGELSQFVDDIVVPESMINHILVTPVTEQDFLEQLYILNHKISFVKEQSVREARSCLDVQDTLEKLKIKALSKIREYILQRIYQFRKPMANYMIPQNALIKHKFYYEFLLANERGVAREVRDEYVDTMGKIYFSYFKSYAAKLSKLQFEEVATKEDVLGADDTTKKSLFSTKTTLKNRSAVFSLGDRAQLITTKLEEQIVVPHSALKDEKKCSYEAIFRSIHWALVDNACREYLFISEFFLVSGQNGQNLFNDIWGKTVHLLIKQLEVSVLENFDSISLFVCINIVHRYRLIMHKRAVSALDKYWETVLEIIWPRFEYLFRLNIQSIREVDPQRMHSMETVPHYVTRRYAEFSAALAILNEGFPEARVAGLLAQLQDELLNCLLRMAAEFAQRKDQLVFLINNYDMIVGVLTGRTKDDTKECDGFKNLLSARIHEYIEEILAPHFGGIISFVKDAEVVVERGQGESLKREEKRVQTLIKAFSVNWKRSVDEINSEIMKSFTNLKNGSNIVQLALTQLVQYYHRFQKILSQAPLKTMSCRSELINIHHIMVEMKKYKTNF